MNKPFLVAAAQLAPAFLDLEASIDKACQWISKAGQEDVKVLVFPPLCGATLPPKRSFKGWLKTVRKSRRLP
jgi:predicted amidohydrolase